MSILSTKSNGNHNIMSLDDALDLVYDVLGGEIADYIRNEIAELEEIKNDFGELENEYDSTYEDRIKLIDALNDTKNALNNVLSRVKKENGLKDDKAIKDGEKAAKKAEKTIKNVLSNE